MPKMRPIHAPVTMAGTNAPDGTWHPYATANDPNRSTATSSKETLVQNIPLWLHPK